MFFPHISFEISFLQQFINDEHSRQWQNIVNKKKSIQILFRKVPFTTVHNNAMARSQNIEIDKTLLSSINKILKYYTMQHTNNSNVRELTTDNKQSS